MGVAGYLRRQAGAGSVAQLSEPRRPDRVSWLQTSRRPDMDSRASGSLRSVWRTAGRGQPTGWVDPCLSCFGCALGLVLLQGLLRHDRDITVDDEVQARVSRTQRVVHSGRLG